MTSLLRTAACKAGGTRREACVTIQNRQPKRLVVADDEHHIRTVVAAKMRSAGFEVVEARDGAEALEACFRTLPDLVVTDLQMPLMSGLELCMRLKLDARTASTPVVMLTARGYILDEGQLSQTNIRELMSKPFGAKELLRRVQAALGMGEGERASESGRGEGASESGAGLREAA